jgi:CHAT domain
MDVRGHELHPESPTIPLAVFAIRVLDGSGEECKMADRDSAPQEYEFHLTVGGGKITVQQLPRTRHTDLPPVDLELKPESDPERQATIEILVNMLRENRLSMEREFEVLGAKLYTVLFANEIGVELHDAIHDPAVKYLRLVLEFEAQDPNSLVSWPWEYLYSPERRGRSGYWLAQVPKLVLTRHIVTDPINPLRVIDRPIKVLFVAASPSGADIDYTVDHAEALGALHRLDSSLGKALNETKVLDLWTLCDVNDNSGRLAATAKYDEFKSLAATLNPHIIHFVGHGKFERGHGLLAFTDDDRGPRWVKDTELAGDLARMNVPDLRVVVLQACEGGRPVFAPPADSLVASSGLATALAKQGVPAVVAMQYQVEQKVADLFVSTFYDALGDFDSVDAAVLKGRIKLWDIEREAKDAGEEGSGRRPAFGLPILYLSQSDLLVHKDEGQKQAGAGAPGAGGGYEEARPARPANCPWCLIELVEGDIKFCRAGHYLRCPNTNNDGTPCQVWIQEDRTACGSCGGVLKRPAAGLRQDDVFSRQSPASTTGIGLG